MSNIDHLALAKEDLTIAESTDAEREAYKRAAEHIVAFREDRSNCTCGRAKNHRNDCPVMLERIAIRLSISASKVDKLLAWRASGYKANTPALADGKATTRAAKSHAKAVLKDPEQLTEVAASLTDDERTKVITTFMAENAKDDGLDDAVKKNEQRTHEERARKMTDRALDSLKARHTYYGDIPLTDDERNLLGYVIQLAQSLRGESEMDAAIEEWMNA